MLSIKKTLGNIWFESVRLAAKVVAYPLFRIRVFGRGNIPKDGPLLLLCNHQSFLDPMFCQVSSSRKLAFIARDSLFKIPGLGQFIRTLNTIPIKRGEADIAAMRKIIEKLKNDSAVCLFPEGTRTEDGRISEVKAGFSLLSRRAGANVIPVVIDGSFECWPKGRKFFLLRKVVISYGKPIAAEEVKRIGDREFAKKLTDLLRELQNECRAKIGKEPFNYDTNS